MAIPRLDLKKNSNLSPHVVILGAGASLAALPDGDKFGAKLPLMSNIVEVLGLEEIIKKYGAEYSSGNFEEFYDELSKFETNEELLVELEKCIEDYFDIMDLPDEATIYDYLVLSLRSKDIIATFNWDPFLAKAFQRNGEKIGYENLPQIVFLHGNVSIGICKECKRKGWVNCICNVCQNILKPSKLLYPVGDKDYSKDPFIFNEWETLQNYLQSAYFVTIFGYSAPKTDLEARKLLLEVWTKNQINEFAIIEVVDLKDEKLIEDAWKDFIIGDNFGVYDNIFKTYMSSHPRRSCDAFAMATLQQNPWRENKLPMTTSLHELQEWIKPLIREEKNEWLSGKPCLR
ncbi:MAG: hypothetical protein GQ564_19915 [Bacteroidales bacterium]|nr:hypothetical protein [Bacteroidales bacterium]